MLAAAAIAVGGAGIAFSFAQTAMKANPALAHRLFPFDGRVTASLASSVAGTRTTTAARNHADRLARMALRQDPTAVAAVSTLGINAQLRSDVTGARRSFAYAQTLSRRHDPTQLWAIEDAVARNDIPEALHQYDIALRVSPRLTSLLFPVLAGAASDAEIREALVRTLAARPAWGDGFANFLASDGPDPRIAATTFVRLRQAGVEVPDAARIGTVNALVRTGQVDAAWRYYTVRHPQADRGRSRDPEFAADATAATTFDWVPVEDAGITASIRHGDAGGVFDFVAVPGAGGPLLQQVQLLTLGDYRLSGRSDGIVQPEDSRPYWVLKCGDGREAGRVSLSDSARNGGAFEGMFRVPAGCPVQTLILYARPTDTTGGLSGQILRAELVPAS